MPDSFFPTRQVTASSTATQPESTKFFHLLTLALSNFMATSQHLAWALLLAAARRVGESERWIRSEKPWVWAPTFLLGRELRATTLGIVGLGRIGRAVARRGLGFGMTIAYHNRQPLPPAMLGGLPAHYRDLPTLLSSSDVICLCCPLTEKTRHLIDATALGQMRRSAVLVNIAAGGIVDENALADALDSGEIFAAALDGYEHEPRVHPRLIAHERVVLAPHLGSATEQPATPLASSPYATYSPPSTTTTTHHRCANPTNDADRTRHYRPLRLPLPERVDPVGDRLFQSRA